MVIGQRWMVGFDVECPAVALIVHRCHKFAYLQLLVFYVQFHYGRVNNGNDEDEE